MLLSLLLGNVYDRFPKIQFPLPKLSTAKISVILLKTTNKSERFSAKAFLIRGTAMERHACSYTVGRDVSLKFISANKGLPRAILLHDTACIVR